MSDFELTEEYLRNSILTSYPQETLDLFKERCPEMWNNMFSTPKLRVVR